MRIAAVPLVEEYPAADEAADGGEWSQWRKLDCEKEAKHRHGATNIDQHQLDRQTP